jgi:hypothetical protein
MELFEVTSSKFDNKVRDKMSVDPPIDAAESIETLYTPFGNTYSHIIAEKQVKIQNFKNFSRKSKKYEPHPSEIK